MAPACTAIAELARRAQLAQVEQQHDAAVAVDGRAADAGQPAEERAEVLDDQLELALERVDRPGQLLAGAAVADDDGGPRRRARPGTPSAPPRSASGIVVAVAQHHRRAGDGRAPGVGQATRLDDAGDRQRRSARRRAGRPGSAARRGSPAA